MAKWKSRYEYEYEVELSRPLFDYPFLFRVSALRVPKSDIMNMKADSLGEEHFTNSSILTFSPFFTATSSGSI